MRMPNLPNVGRLLVGLWLYTMSLAHAQSDPEKLQALRGGEDEAAARALVELTQTPQATLQNLPTLLETARDADKEMNREFLLPKYGDDIFWHTYRKRGALTLARVADVIREGDEAAKHQALFLMKPFMEEAIKGNFKGVAPQQILECFYYCIFYPYEVSPHPSQDLDLVVSTLKEYFEHGENRVRSKANSLLFNSAYILRERREELLTYLDQHLDPMEDPNAHIERVLNYQGEPLSREEFDAIRQQSDQVIIENVLTNRNTGNNWRLNNHELMERLDTLQNREEVVRQLLEKSSLHGVGIALDPISENAPEADKRLRDIALDIFTREITHPKPRSGERWALIGLQKLMFSFYDEPTKPETPREYKPYGRDRIVDLLLTAVKSQEPQVPDDAAHVLARVAWTGKDVAHKIFAELQSVKTTRERNYDPNRPDNPLRAELGERPEKGALEEVIHALGEAEKAVQAFETTENIPVVYPAVRLGTLPVRHMAANNNDASTPEAPTETLKLPEGAPHALTADPAPKAFPKAASPPVPIEAPPAIKPEWELRWLLIPAIILVLVLAARVIARKRFSR